MKLVWSTEPPPHHAGPAPRTLPPTPVPDAAGDDDSWLRGNDLFAPMPAAVLDRLRALSQLRTQAAGTVLFTAGSPEDALHVIRSGVVEITRADAATGEERVVARLKAGDLIGDVGVFAGVPHLAGARVVESGQILVLGRQQLELLIQEFPDLAWRLCHALAARLQALMARLDHAGPDRRRLEGSLRFIGLSNVLESLLSDPSATGTFSIRDADGGAFGSIVITNGRVWNVWHAGLRGEDALLQLFCDEARASTFSFEESVRDAARRCPTVQGGLFSLPASALVLEATRIKDETKTLAATCPWKRNSMLRRNAVAFAWSDAGTREIAEVIWRCAGEPLGVEAVLASIARCDHAKLSVLRKMLDAGLVAV